MSTRTSHDINFPHGMMHLLMTFDGPAIAPNPRHIGEVMTDFEF